jgi:hypothetical protein
MCGESIGGPWDSVLPMGWQLSLLAIFLDAKGFTKSDIGSLAFVFGLGEHGSRVAARSGVSILRSFGHAPYRRLAM